jgi:hypothetical protein
LVSPSNTVNPAKIKNTEQVQKIDIKTFIEKAQADEIGKGELTYEALDGEFDFTDLCGRNWDITYWGITFEQALAILAELGYLLCIINFFLILL